MGTWRNSRRSAESSISCSLAALEGWGKAESEHGPVIGMSARTDGGTSGRWSGSIWGMVPYDDEKDALRPVRIEKGVVTRPASAWSPTVHAFLRYLRGQGLTCVPEPIAVEGGVERLVAISKGTRAQTVGRISTPTTGCAPR